MAKSILSCRFLLAHIAKKNEAYSNAASTLEWIKFSKALCWDHPAKFNVNWCINSSVFDNYNEVMFIDYHAYFQSQLRYLLVYVLYEQQSWCSNNEINFMNFSTKHAYTGHCGLFFSTKFYTLDSCNFRAIAFVLGIDLK